MSLRLHLHNQAPTSIPICSCSSISKPAQTLLFLVVLVPIKISLWSSATSGFVSKRTAFPSNLLKGSLKFENELARFRFSCFKPNCFHGLQRWLCFLLDPTMNTRSQGLKMDHPPADAAPSLLTQRPRALAPRSGTQRPGAPSSKAATPTAPAAPEEIIINVVFLSPPDDISDLSLAIHVSPKLLDLPLTSCMTEFAKAIKDFYSVTLRCDYTFQFLAPKKKILGKDCYSSTPDFCNTLSQQFEPTSGSVILREFWVKACSQANQGEQVVALGIKGLSRSDPQGEESDLLSPLRCFERLLQNSDMSPSAGAKSLNYAKLQADPAKCIYDGRRAPNGNHETVAPPIHIYNPIFSRFYDLLAEAPSRVTEDLLRKTQDFMAKAAVVSTGEEDRRLLTWKALREILGFSLHSERNTDRSLPDGVHTIEIGNIGVCVLVIEVKREMGEGGSDPTIQVSISFRKNWIFGERDKIRDICNCPTFLLAVGGPWLCVLGGVITKDVIVQRLTSMEWTVASSTEDDVQVLKVANIFWALRESLKELKEFYKTLIIPTSPEPLSDTHSRFYPSPTTFEFKGQTITFRYLEPLQPHATCVTYKAEIIKVPPGCQGLPFKEGSHVVVKFVSRYGEDVHRFLEKRGFAPALFYVGKVLAWEGAVKARSPEVKPLVRGLTFTTSTMVVMEFVENAKLEVLTKKDLAQQVANIIYCLHCAGLAFGDVRPPNILVDVHLKRVKFIDFNWAGQFDPRLSETEANLAGVPSIIHGKIKAMEDLPLETDTARFPLNISSEVFEGLGSSLGLTPILPWHDWKMWSLHFGRKGGFLNTDIIFGTLG